MTEARLGRTTLFLPVSGGEEDDTELMDGRRGLIDDADEAELADGESARSCILLNEDEDADADAGTIDAELRSAKSELTLDASPLFAEANERKDDMGTVVVMGGRAGDFELPLKSSAGSLSAGSPSMCKSG